MKIHSKQAASLEQLSATEEHLEAEIDLSIEHRFSQGRAFDKAASFTMDREQIYRELVSFVADGAVPDLILAMRPEWERVPPILHHLNTRSKQTTNTNYEISSDSFGFTYNGKIYVTANTSNSRPVRFAESIYNSRDSIGTAIANTVTQALRDHFFEISESSQRTQTRSERGPEGNRIVERQERWQRPDDNLDF